MSARAVLLTMAALLAVTPAGAEPYMAVREGFKCSACHVNMTGGGKRNDLVAAHSHDVLHYPRFLPALAKPAQAFTGVINEYLAVGGNLRLSNTAIFQELGNDGRVHNNTAFRGRLEANEIDANEAVAYIEARLIPDVLSFYLDQRFAPQTNTREAWGLLRLPRGVYLKAGKMFLPYGLQLQDDTAFIRGGRNGSVNTGFSFQQQQAGFEVGFEPGPFEAVATVSDGPANDRDVQVTGTLYTMLTDLPVVRNVLLGGSFSRVAPPGVETIVFGFFTGAALGPVTYLGEVDFRSDRDDTTGGKSRGRFIQYSEANCLLFDWLNTKVAFDYADDDGDLSQRGDDSENRFSIGVEPFLNRFLQLRLFYRVSNGVRSAPSHNQDLWIAEAHLFF